MSQAICPPVSRCQLPGWRGTNTPRCSASAVLHSRFCEEHLWHRLFRHSRTLVATSESTRNSGLLTTIGWAARRTRSSTRWRAVSFRLERPSSGSAMGWGLIETSEESESLASEVDDNGGVYLVPAFAGLGAPVLGHVRTRGHRWTDQGTTKSHVARAALESIAYQTRDILDLMQKDVRYPYLFAPSRRWRYENRLLMQFQADVLGSPDPALGGEGDHCPGGRIPGRTRRGLLEQPGRDRRAVAGGRDVPSINGRESARKPVFGLAARRRQVQELGVLSDGPTPLTMCSM